MYIGVDLGGTNIAGGLVDENGKIIQRKSVKTDSSRDYKEILKDMALCAKAVVEESGVGFDTVKAVGIGSPGTIDSKNGVIIYANNLHFDHVPIVEEFKKHYDIDVYIDNDGNCAAFGEVLFGGARGAKDAMAITIGTGVGAGIVIDGKIYSGFNGAGGEYGHMVICVDGEPCNCGRRGCYEAYASATALIRQTKEKMQARKDSLMWEECGGNLDNVNGRTAFDASRKGDDAAKEVVDQFIYYFSEGVVNAINIFQPEVILVGGGVAHEGDYLLDPVREHVKKFDYFRGDKKTQIKRAELGNDAGIIGAAYLATQFQK